MASNIEVKDAGTTSRTLKTTEVGSLHTPHHHVDSIPATAAEGGALPGVFMVVAGDDGTDTHPLQVDSAGLLRVTSTASAVAGESAALPSEFMVVAGDDGTNTHPLQVDDSTGGLKVILQTGSVIPTGAATAANQASIIADTAAIQTAVESTDISANVIAGASYVDDADWTDGTSRHLLVGGLYQTAPQVVTNGDVAPFQIDVNGHAKVAVKIPGVLVQFLVTIAATQAIMATNTLNSGVTLKADAANTGSVFVGFSTGVTTANGHPLAAGDTLFLELSNTNLIFTIGTASDKLWVIGS